MRFKRLFLRILRVILIILLFLYVVIGLLVAQKIITPLRFKIDQTYVGGLPYFLVYQRLNKYQPPPTITFIFNHQSQTFPLHQLDITISPSQSFSQWQNHFNSLTPLQRWQLYTQNLYHLIYLNPEINFDPSHIINILSQSFADEWNTAQPAKLTYNQGRLVYLPATNGYQLERKELIKRLREVLQKKQKTISLPLIQLNLKPTKEEKAKVYAKATQLLRSKIILKRKEKEVELTPQEKISLLSFYQPLDEKSLENVAEDKQAFFNSPPENALFEFKNGRVIAFKPSKPGFQTNLEALKEDLRNVFSQGTLPSKIIIPIKGRYIQPKITTKDTNSYGIKELVGQGDSWFWHSSAGRVHNVKLAASRLNGILVAPGEVFSFNQALGNVSAATGYRQSYVIREGKTILDDGGGVCQVSTTLFRAVLKAGLPIIERHAHSYRVGYYEEHSPPGFDATVFAPHVDLKFKNDLPSYLLIQTKVDHRYHLIFSLYGTKDGRQVTISSPRIWDQTPPPPPSYQDDPTLPLGTVKQVEWPAWGAKVAFDWRVIKDGKILHQQTFLSVYKPWRAVYLRHL